VGACDGALSQGNAACHPAGGEVAEEGAVRSEAVEPAMAGADTVWRITTTRGGVYGRRSTDHQRVFVKACEAVQSQAHPGHSRLPQAPEVHRKSVGVGIE